MSREIKFRVWDKDLKKMHICGENQHDSISFSYPENEAHYYNLQNGCGSSTDGSGTYELMQYTNLKDKNGKEIYEGDVVDYLGDIELVNSDVLRVIEYKNEEACYVARLPVGVEGEEAVYLNEHDFKVIGNIYENPELLEATA